MKSEIVETRTFVADAVARIVEIGREAIAARGEFRLSLCGGSTPVPVYEALAGEDLAWSRVFVTFGDERCVGPDDAQSNFRMAREAFLGRVPIPGSNVLRMRGEARPVDAAGEYEAALRGHAAPGEELFRHDLILLGMGGDGHTASLFPGSKALEETDRAVVENHVEKLDSWRITFTYPLINASRAVMFLVNDPSKRPVLDAVLAGAPEYPSSGVAPTDGRLIWLVGVQ